MCGRKGEFDRMKKEILREDIPRIRELFHRVTGEAELAAMERMGGLTNHTYKVTGGSGREYVVRIPGEGTEELIVRGDEEIHTRLACGLGIDAELLYFGKDGSKVTAYIPDAVTMSPESMKEEPNVCRAADIFRVLHRCGEDTGVPFDVFEMAGGYERFLENNGVALYEDYPRIKAEVMQIKADMDSVREPERVPCHNDPLCENWVMGPERMYLIDWEYAGMNDGMWDLADLSIEAGYGNGQDECLLRRYLGHAPEDVERMAFLANKLYLDYLWTLWGKTRVPFDGQPMEDYASERYARLKENLARYYRLKGVERG